MKQFSKKTASLGLVLVMLLSMAGCGRQPAEQGDTAQAPEAPVKAASLTMKPEAYPRVDGSTSHSWRPLLSSAASALGGSTAVCAA